MANTVIRARPIFRGIHGESIHAHEYIDPPNRWICRQAYRRRRHRQLRRRPRLRTFPEVLRNTVYLSTRSGAWVVPKYVFGMTADKIAHSLPVIPLSWQRRAMQPFARLMFGDPQRYGLPKPNHRFLEAHPTQSAELLMRLGSGDATAKPNIERLDGRSVVFVDGSSVEADVIIYATGYNITFPFFDRSFLEAPDNKLPLYKRILKPGIDDLLFIGFAQACPRCSRSSNVRPGWPRPISRAPTAHRRKPRCAHDRRRRAQIHRAYHRQATAHPAGRLLGLRTQHAQA
jgi:hypothetical protein